MTATIEQIQGWIDNQKKRMDEDLKENRWVHEKIIRDFEGFIAARQGKKVEDMEDPLFIFRRDLSKKSKPALKELLSKGYTGEYYNAILEEYRLRP